MTQSSIFFLDPLAILYGDCWTLLLPPREDEVLVTPSIPSHTVPDFQSTVLQAQEIFSGSALEVEPLFREENVGNTVASSSHFHTSVEQLDSPARQYDTVSPSQLHDNFPSCVFPNGCNELAWLPQQDSPSSPSLLTLEQATISSPSPPVSPLVGVPGLIALPSPQHDASPLTTPPFVFNSPSLFSLDSDGSDADAESGSDSVSSSGVGYSSGSDDDDEYVPLPLTRATRRPCAKPPVGAPRARASTSTKGPRPLRSRRHSPYPPPSPSPSTSSLSSSSDTGSPGPRGVKLRHTSSRKAQVSIAAAKNEQTEDGKPRWNCPHCSYVQSNHRGPDLRRHIAGHCKSDTFVCCGVPIQDAARYNVTDFSDAAEWKGQIRVGGCWQVCSRRDALTRHVKNPKRACVCELVPSKVLEVKARK